MPRVAINKKKYMLQDLYVWINGKMLLKDVNQTRLGEMLGISQQAAGARLSGLKAGRDTLKHNDLAIIFKEFEATDEEILRFMKL